jgi:hypothetical protein
VPFRYLQLKILPLWAKVHWYIKYEEIGNRKLPVFDKLLKYEGEADTVRFTFFSSKKRNKKNFGYMLLLFKVC